LNARKNGHKDPAFGGGGEQEFANRSKAEGRQPRKRDLSQQGNRLELFKGVSIARGDNKGEKKKDQIRERHDLK